MRFVFQIIGTGYVNKTARSTGSTYMNVNNFDTNSTYGNRLLTNLPSYPHSLVVLLSLILKKKLSYGSDLVRKSLLLVLWWPFLNLDSFFIFCLVLGNVDFCLSWLCERKGKRNKKTCVLTLDSWIISLTSLGDSLDCFRVNFYYFYFCLLN